MRHGRGQCSNDRNTDREGTGLGGGALDTVERKVCRNGACGCISHSGWCERVFARRVSAISRDLRLLTG